MTEPEEIKAEVERTRAELAHTVDQLGEKLNVKAQAGKKAESAKQSVVDTVHRVDTATRPHRAQIAAGVAAVLVAVLVIRRVRR
ncbi:DUF3618 domain-containing protein [Jatrophihabitans fulvus]